MILNPKNKNFEGGVIFLQFYTAEDRIVPKWIEINQDNLRTETAISSRSSREH